MKLTGTLFGSDAVFGLSKGPKSPLRPVVNGVEALLHSDMLWLHSRSTPVWFEPKRVPSTDTTCPSVSMSLGVTLSWGSKKWGSDGLEGSVGSSVVAKAVPTRAVLITTTRATNALLLAGSFFTPASSTRV